MTTSSDELPAGQPDDEHEHRPERDSWKSLETGLPADLMDLAQYPVTATCDTCRLPIYGRSFASAWLLREPYIALHGPFNSRGRPAIL